MVLSVAVATNVAAAVLMVLRGRVRTPSAGVLHRSSLALYAVSAVLMFGGALGFESVVAKVAVAFSAVSTVVVVWILVDGSAGRAGRRQGSEMRA